MRIAGAGHTSENALAVVRDQVEQMLFVRHAMWASLDTEWWSNRDYATPPAPRFARISSSRPAAETLLLWTSFASCERTHAFAADVGWAALAGSPPRRR